MAYVNVPKDLTKVKSKVLLNLTQRQLICFGCGALVGVPLFFLLKKPIGTSSGDDDDGRHAPGVPAGRL